MLDVEHRERIGHREDHGAAVELHREDVVRERDVLRHEREHLGRDRAAPHVDEHEPGLPRERPRDVLEADVAEVDQALPDLLSRLLLVSEGVFEMLRGQDPGLDEDLAEPWPSAPPPAGWSSSGPEKSGILPIRPGFRQSPAFQRSSGAGAFHSPGRDLEARRMDALRRPCMFPRPE